MRRFVKREVLLEVFSLDKLGKVDITNKRIQKG